MAIEKDSADKLFSPPNYARVECLRKHSVGHHEIAAKLINAVD
ncbi:MAG: hypothetical protein WC100_18610 [Sterolibacterium sp.]